MDQLLWIQIHWILNRIQNFNPIWIQIQGYIIIYENNVKNSLIQKILNLKTIFVKNYKRIMVRQKIANKLVFMTNNKS